MIEIKDSIIPAALIQHFLKGGLDRRNLDILGHSAAGFLNRTYGKMAEPYDLSAEDKKVVAELTEKGFAWFPPLFSNDEISEIHTHFENQKAYFWNNDFGDSSMVEGKLAECPDNMRFASFDQASISNCASFARVAHDPRLLALAEAYLQAPPTMSIFTAWWSYPSNQPEAGMQYFHNDRDDFRELKLFVYLSDVNSSNGPHMFVERSHTTSVLSPWVAKTWPTVEEQERFWSWMEFHRKSNDTVQGIFPPEWIRTVTGPLGATFFEDTHGIHKGMPPKTGSRFVFQICYSLMAKLNQKYESVPRPSWLSPGFRAAYATRQYYD
ncbi:MAG: hypothetical protein EXR11_04730 [Rhodospirillaceae bacterium]|nr:hypothetical protein [Rhodospirillaceae bacterium]